MISQKHVSQLRHLSCNVTVKLEKECGCDERNNTTPQIEELTFIKQRVQEQYSNYELRSLNEK